jgi:hypothetical protein
MQGFLKYFLGFHIQEKPVLNIYINVVLLDLHTSIKEGKRVEHWIAAFT